MKTGVFWKGSMPRPDYKQLKVENQAANVSADECLRNWPSWQSTATRSSHLCCNQNRQEALSLRAKDFCQVERTLIHCMHLYHVIYKDKTWVLRVCFCSVTVPKAHQKNSEKRGRGSSINYYVHAQHTYSHRYILEMVIYKMEVHGETMLYSKGGYYLKLVLFDAFGVRTQPISL